MVFFWHTLFPKENYLPSEAEQSRELKTLISSKCSKAEVLSDVGAAAADPPRWCESATGGGCSVLGKEISWEFSMIRMDECLIHELMF